MEVLHPHCAGLDVHKQSMMAAVRHAQDGGKSKKEVRRYGTTTAQILELADWMETEGVTHVALESTGVYWKPIYNLLEGRFELLLVNPQHIKQVPGRKTDVKDCEWIAELLALGLLRPSFVPPRPLRELRDLTRHRVQVVEEKTRVANRIQKVLEDANIKLSSVASNPLGVSGRAILGSLLQGHDDAEELSDLARGALRKKLPELREALAGRVTEHHRFMLSTLMEHLAFLEEQEGHLSRRIEEVMRQADATAAAPQAPEPPDRGPWAASGTLCAAPSSKLQVASEPPSSEEPAAQPQPQREAQPPPSFDEALKLLVAIPGVDVRTAQCVLAEIGTDMSQFPSAACLASWAGLCPGNDQSAGKRKDGKTRKGNRWLRRALGQAAWAASASKKSYLAAQFRRLCARRGKARAIVAVAHTLLGITYYLLKTGAQYVELGRDYFDRLDPKRLTRHLVKRLEALGHHVILESHPQPDAA
jgi:transposase